MYFPQREETGIEFLKPAEVHGAEAASAMGAGALPASVGPLWQPRGIESNERQFTFPLETPSIFSQFQSLITANS